MKTALATRIALDTVLSAGARRTQWNHSDRPAHHIAIITWVDIKVA